MISLMIDKDNTVEEVKEFKELVGTEKQIYDDVEKLISDVSNLTETVDDIAAEQANMCEYLASLDETETINDRDLNELTGRIIIGYGNGCLNKPTGANGFLINLPHNSAPDQFGKQIWFTRPLNNVYVRNLENGVFGDWMPIRFDSGWNNLTLANGVTPQNPTQYPCRYRKVNDVVYVDGCVKNLTAFSTIICTLPENYRPSKSYYFQAATNVGKTDTFRVHTDGRIEWMASTGETGATQYHFINTSFLI